MALNRRTPDQGPWFWEHVVGQLAATLRQHWPGDVPGDVLAGLFDGAGRLRAACAGVDEAAIVGALASRVDDERRVTPRLLCALGAPTPELVTAAAAYGLRVVVGTRPPEELAVATASEHGLTLCAADGPQTVEVFSAPQRILRWCVPLGFAP